MSDLTFRAATDADLPAIVAMLADDHLGAQRESLDDLVPYRRALAEISADANLVQVVCEHDGEIVGTMQLSILPGLSHRGMSRMVIEGVRVRSTERGGGIGSEMIGWAIAFARDRACGQIELTTDKSREAAHRFYARLGFVQSHLGFKLKLD